MDTLFRIAELNALETANHVAASEIQIRFGGTSTLAQAIKENRLSPLQFLEYRKEF